MISTIVLHIFIFLPSVVSTCLISLSLTMATLTFTLMAWSTSQSAGSSTIRFETWSWDRYIIGQLHNHLFTSIEFVQWNPQMGDNWCCYWMKQSALINWFQCGFHCRCKGVHSCCKVMVWTWHFSSRTSHTILKRFQLSMKASLSSISWILMSSMTSLCRESQGG